MTDVETNEHSNDENGAAVKKSGFVALIGRPNVGKSTLLNTLLDEKISITSPKAQTTRWQILGMKRFLDAQIIYIDTPGMHQEEKRAMNRYLNRVASAAVTEADVLLWLLDARGLEREDELVLKKLKGVNVPIILVLNKIDLLKDKTELLPLMEKLAKSLQFAEMIPISALEKDNTHALETSIVKLLPPGSLLFPEDQLTDKTERFLVAEMIREKVITLTEEELPYTTTVAVEQFQQHANLIEISAVIWVEKPGQKAIIIGKGGTKLKKIGTFARRDIEKSLSTKVFLRLWVKVKNNWTDDDKALRALGYE